MRHYIVGNWKMNGSAQRVGEMAQALGVQLDPKFLEEKRVVICPPAPYIAQAVHEFKDTPFDVGAQDCSAHASGAYTGEVSPLMLKDVGCQYVILGHSERRHGWGESSDLVCQKVQQAQSASLTTIICIGETAEDRQRDKTIEVLKAQVDQSLPQDTVVDKTIIAYEPVWAIGTGVTPTPKEANGIHEIIRGYLLEKFQTYEAIPLIYGGSVTPENAHDFLAQPFIQGVLVGGASLKPDDFSKIVAS